MSTYVTQYQSANLSDAQIIDNFVVRTKEFERVMADIRTTDKDSSFQHYVFVGRRGSGKSTLLRRIQAEVCTDPALKEKFIVTNLSEEQAGIYKLYDLWDYVIRDLRAKDYSLPEIDWQEYQEDMKEYTKVLYGAIHDLLQKEDKRLILLVDNIDRIFKNIGKEANLLREQLMNFNDVRIIGGSTIMAEDFWRYDMPFYEFFSIKRLEPLSLKEIKVLLEHWAKVRGNPEIAKFVEQHPGKIQAVRMLTDGAPRTMQLFVDMLIDRRNQQGFDYLQRIIDSATPIYQERLGQLSTQQQKIVVELSFFRKAASVEQLVPVCKMSGKNISAQMAQLVKARIVEKVKGEKKNMYYQLEERFFNLWLLMTQGGPKQKKERMHLTMIIETWYNREEILGIYNEFVQKLDDTYMRPDFIASMASALAHSKHITLQQRDNLINKVNSQGQEKIEWLGLLPDTFQKLLQEAIELLQAGKRKDALALISELEQDDGWIYGFRGAIHKELGNYFEAERLLQLAIVKGEREFKSILGYTYLLQSKFVEAEKEFLDLSKDGDVEAINILAYIYQLNGNFANAESQYLMAITKGNPYAMNNLGTLYQSKGEMEKAQAYYKMGDQIGFPASSLNLARIYYFENRNQMEARYLIDKALSQDSTNLEMQIMKAMILLWIGEIQEHQQMIDILWIRLLNTSPIWLDGLARHLLIHKQYHFLSQQFKTQDSLKESIQTLYYAYLQIQDSTSWELDIMPPELREVVGENVEYILERQAFYYGKQS